MGREAPLHFLWAQRVVDDVSTVRPSRVLEELLHLSRRINVSSSTRPITSWTAVLDDADPATDGAAYDFRLFYEVKANLRKSQSPLRAAGITRSSRASRVSVRRRWPHTQRMHGAAEHPSAQVVRELTASRCTGTSFMDFPETIRPSISRWPRSPATACTWKHRISSRYPSSVSVPITMTDAFGIEILGPKAHYRHTYPVGRVLNDIAYAFEHRQLSARRSNPG